MMGDGESETRVESRQRASREQQGVLSGTGQARVGRWRKSRTTRAGRPAREVESRTAAIFRDLP